MSTRGAGDLEENKIFKEICMEGMTSGKGDKDRTSNLNTWRREHERIFGQRKTRPRTTKVIYHSDGTKTEKVKEF
jgi:hypothetical protein